MTVYVTREDSVIAAPQIETATLADLDALGRLRLSFDWHRSDTLMRAALGWDGARVFVIRAGRLAPLAGVEAEQPAVTVNALAAAPIGVIGNVGVRPDFQRRGLGGVIMRHALDWLRSQGVRSVYLDATPAGRPLYLQLGFQPVTPSWFAHAPLTALDMQRLSALAGDRSATRRPPSEIARIAQLDRAAFGGDRLGLLAALAEQDDIALYIADAAEGAGGAPLGYALARQLEAPITGARLGPLVAPDDAVAAALTLAILHDARQQHEDAPVPVPDTQPVQGEPRLFASGASDLPRARAFFSAIGMPPEDDDLVMRLILDADVADEAVDRDAPSEKGRPSVYSWVSPMTF